MASALSLDIGHCRSWARRISRRLLLTDPLAENMVMVWIWRLLYCTHTIRTPHARLPLAILRRFGIQSSVPICGCRHWFNSVGAIYLYCGLLLDQLQSLCACKSVHAVCNAHVVLDPPTLKDLQIKFSPFVLPIYSWKYCLIENEYVTGLPLSTYIFPNELPNWKRI